MLCAYPGLSLKPITNGLIRLAGTLSFSADAPGLEQIDDAFDLDIAVPAGFPRALPIVRETGGRIPEDFHTVDDGSLCLGSPTQQQLALIDDRTLPGFVRACIVPYLYGFSYHQKHGRMPFGELDHGMEGIRRDFAALFEVSNEHEAEEMVKLAGMKKRFANKQVCPCGSGRRLGKCHNRRVNQLREELGRPWFVEQYRWLTTG